MFLRLLIIFVLLVLPSGLIAQAKPAKSNTRPAGKPVPTPEPFDNATIEEMTKCVALETEKGTIEVMMFPETAPVTVRNFLNLTAIGAYDNTTFSRVVPDFVIQGGVLHTNKDITYEMSLRALKKLADEPNLVRHMRGIISMARGDEPNSASTSFFILVTRASSLDDKFAAFGRVVKGMDVVDLINKMPVVEETPKEPVLISKATVKTCDPVSEVPSDVSNVVPEPAPKVNELPRFGFRGRVKSVRETTFELKEKKKDWRKADQHSIGESLTEFGESGDFVRMVFPKEDLTLINTNEYPPLGSKSDFTFKDVLRNSEGEIVSEAVFKRISATRLEYVFYGKSLKVSRKGTIETNTEGRNLRQESQEIDGDGKIKSSLVTTMTYDPYGFMTSHIQVDGNGERVFYNRYEYPDLDDRANWTTRLVFDSEDSKNPVQIVKRVFEYYGEKVTGDK